MLSEMIATVAIQAPVMAGRNETVVLQPIARRPRLMVYQREVSGYEAISAVQGECSLQKAEPGSLH